MSTKEQIEQLENDLGRYREMNKNQSSYIDELTRTIEKKNCRVDALLWSLVIAQDVCRLRENEVLAFRKKFGELSLAG